MKKARETQSTSEVIYRIQILLICLGLVPVNFSQLVNFYYTNVESICAAVYDICHNNQLKFHFKNLNRYSWFLE
jgi:hypothetical protein